jgi:hypothetical protein
VVSETEALWEVTGHGAVFVERRPERATGHAMHVLFVGDLDERVAAISERGIETRSASAAVPRSLVPFLASRTSRPGR